LGYISLNFGEEVQKSKESSEFERSYELPDGRVIVLGKERFLGPEILFQPSLLYESNPPAGIPELVRNSIEKCDVTLRPQLYSTILLAGGNTLWKGFKERVEQDLLKLVPPGTGVQVLGPKQYSAWIGGSMVSHLP